MKTNKFLNLLIIVALFGLTFAGCKKDSTSPTSSSPGQIAAAQDAESQDAVLTKVEQGADDQADALEASNFNISEAKAGTINGVTITISHPDTTHFPKVITMDYNFNDTVNGEHMSQTGQITIAVDTIPVGKKLWWRKHVKRTFTFNNFTVTNDSSSFTINGTRTMERKNWIPSISDNSLKTRIEVRDTIYSSMVIDVTCGAFSGSFTRNLNRSRDIFIHYFKLLPHAKIWNPLFNDTLIIKGSTMGTNLQDSVYSRVITTPLVFSRCPVWPHNLIASGVIKDTEGTRVTTITYSPEGCKNKVTATNANGNVVKLDHKINRKFKHWWK